MIYLDNGATSFPKPNGMVQAMNDCIANYCGNPGRSGHNMSVRTGEEVYKARKALAALFKIRKPERIVFTINTTEALNLGIKGVLHPGDHVITTEMEHNSVLRPIRALEKKGVQYTFVQCNPDGSVDPKAIEEAICENTKLIVCTQASNVTGTIMPIAEIGKMAKERDILFMVDGAQGAGHMEIDINDVDLLAVPGHKGLLGPLGTGMLYVREGIELNSMIEGGTGTESKETIQPLDFPEGYESGTINAPGIIGLGFSARVVHETGVAAIEAHERGLINLFDQEIRNMPNITVYGPEDTAKKVGIETFNIGNYGCEEVASILNDHYDIAVRGGYHCAGLAHKTIGTWDCGAVRLSVGPYNTEEEIKTAIEAVYQMSKSEPGRFPG